MKIEIVWTADKAEATRWADAGYEPIECAFGNPGSVLGQLAMDHHGVESGREGVALRAYRDHFGVRKDNPRFVVTGAADADATFAIAALCGILPHPSRADEFAKAPPPVWASGTRDISGLAGLINRVDTEIVVGLDATDEGTILLLWNQMGSGAQDETSFHAGIDRWRALLGRAPKALLSAVKAEEANRIAEARKVKMVTVGDYVVVVESPVWGFDVWYSEVAPVIVAFVATNGNITIGCCDIEMATRLFGLGGLKNVFAKLQPQGWGGRETICGSPRGMKFTREQAIEAAKVVAMHIKS